MAIRLEREGPAPGDEIIRVLIWAIHHNEVHFLNVIQQFW